MVNIFKIALTGGPCAGKSSSMQMIKDRFSNDFSVYTLPEIATVIINAGRDIIPEEFTFETRKNLTKNLCQMQIDLEKFFVNLALSNVCKSTKDVIIVSDRGIVDNFAYCSSEMKAKIFEETKWDLDFLCINRYDAIIHLVTAANGARKYYTLENNTARTETIQEAHDLDRKIQEQCLVHPNFKLIDNSVPGFDQKMKRMLNVISSLVYNRPFATTLQNYLLNSDHAHLVSLENKIPKFRYTELITYLKHPDPTFIQSIVKRSFGNSQKPTFTVVEEHFTSSPRSHLQKQRIINDETYVDLIPLRDTLRSDVHREVVSFSISDKDKINLLYLEKYMFADYEQKMNCRKLNASKFGGIHSANDEDSLVFLKVFSDTGKFPMNLFKNFCPLFEDVTNSQDFMIHRVAKIKGSSKGSLFPM